MHLVMSFLNPRVERTVLRAPSKSEMRFLLRTFGSSRLPFNLNGQKQPKCITHNLNA